MNRMTRILEGLVKRTEEGKLEWDTSSDDEEFLTAVGVIAVVVKRLRECSMDGTERHQLIIMNDGGATVETLETESDYTFLPTERCATPVQAQKMARLFTLARRSALNSDSTLDELVKSLEDF